MKTFENGASKEKCTGYQDGRVENFRETMGFSQSDSGIYRNEQDGTYKQDSRRRNSHHSPKKSVGSDGKILDRLKLLQHEYLSYLVEHRQKLKENLDQNIAKEQSFKKAITELEQEIQEIISASRANNESK
ncbi:MAG: hypothetical protein ACFB2X_10325 [Rivularia sp. (in: cyanobacteria)]